MDRILVIALPDDIPESTLQALRLAGWRITLTADIVSAKRLLQERNVATVIVDLASDRKAERLQILHFVHEFCPNTVVILLQSGSSPTADLAIPKFVPALDTLDRVCPQAQLNRYQLSPAQKRIAELAAQAYPNREIARRLKLKEPSVRNQLSKIFRKIGIANRVQLALLLNVDNPTDQPTAEELEQSELQPVLPTSNVHDSLTV
jgi:DNA-binding CsgD family transcriptional regulator